MEYFNTKQGDYSITTKQQSRDTDSVEIQTKLELLLGKTNGKLSVSNVLIFKQTNMKVKNT